VRSGFAKKFLQFSDTRDDHALLVDVGIAFLRSKGRNIVANPLTDSLDRDSAGRIQFDCHFGPRLRGVESVWVFHLRDRKHPHSDDRSIQKPFSRFAIATANDALRIVSGAALADRVGCSD